MSNQRTAWHFLFVAGLSERHPPGFDVLSELPLSTEPLRADVVIIRRLQGPSDDAAAGTLRRLWPQVRHTAVIEFKSPSRSLRSGELAKLFGYGGQYHAMTFDGVRSSENLLLVLVVSTTTPTLLDELRWLRLDAFPVGPGYLRAESRPYTLLVIDLSAVVDAEKDELMSIFVRSKMLTPAAALFLEEHDMTANAPKRLSELEGFNEVVERWLTSVPPAKRLEGLAPAERLEGLATEDLVLALPDDVLKGMSDDCLRTLSPEAQEAIRRRIGRPA